MIYTIELVIELPRKKVLELFDNPDNLYKWQPTLKSFEHISGEPGAEGAVSRLTYKGKATGRQAGSGKEFKMIETITKVNLPEEISFLYEAKGLENWVSNHFYEEGSTSTRWITESEFRFSGFLKLFGFFMRREILKRMLMFKEFAENS
ncbi:MAG: SRPBCC family protein [Promethearchaeota archaeon]|jgi:uncharacterized protein YndB with AHSA1/START domain